MRTPGSPVIASVMQAGSIAFDAAATIEKLCRHAWLSNQSATKIGSS